MINEVRDYIKDAMLEQNDYFNVGFVDVSINPILGIVISTEETEVPVFPSDSFGNYFYIRNNGVVKFGGNIGTGISDCEQSIGVSSSLTIVACVRNAEPDSLLSNIVNTLLVCKKYNIDILEANIERLSVIVNELRFMDNETKMKALANIPEEMTIISININIKTIFNQSKCKDELVCRC